MKINDKDLKEIYEMWIVSNKHDLEFANNILYELCEKYPSNSQKEVAIAKIWLIGRSYAAAIERRKNENTEKSFLDFYTSHVGTAFESWENELDYRLSNLKNDDNALSLHYWLMNKFKEITGMEKRSLASKYLHFHCKDKFYIYDSRAAESIKRFFKKNRDTKHNYEYDSEYKRLYEMATKLKERIGEVYNRDMSSRDIDDLLLFEYAYFKNKQYT